MTKPGTVHLVGAGPGDPQLITLRGLRCLQQTDVVIHDRLIAPQLLDAAPPRAERIFAGKRAGKHALHQEAISLLMVDRARRGLDVVRLKGGDPCLFGRGGEEGQALTKAGIPWEIIPGVTSAIAVPGLAHIPVTHRDTAASLGIVTGHRCESAKEPDWDALARLDTLVVLMGVGTLPHTTRMLLNAGRAKTTPVAVIQNGSMPTQRVVTGTLQNIASRARSARVRPPATIVIGDVVRLRDGSNLRRTHRPDTHMNPAERNQHREQWIGL